METNNAFTRFVLLFLLSLADAGFAQNNSSSSSLPSNTDAFGQGSNVISAGFGLGGDYTYYANGYSSSPNLVLTYDNGTFGKVGPGTISLGGLLAYKGISYSYTDLYSGYTYNQNRYYYIIGLRSAYHWNFTTNGHFDPYIGLMLAYYDIGYRSTSNDPDYNNPGNPYYYYYANNYSSYMAFSLYLGARYYLSNHVGIWLELGYGYSNAAIGVCFKL